MCIAKQNPLNRATHSDATQTAHQVLVADLHLTGQAFEDAQTVLLELLVERVLHKPQHELDDSSVREHLGRKNSP